MVKNRLKPSQRIDIVAASSSYKIAKAKYIENRNREKNKTRRRPV